MLFAYPVTPPPELKAKIEIRGLLSWMAFGDIKAPVRGLDAFKPDEVPPLWMTFVSFHNMVLLGIPLHPHDALGRLELARQQALDQPPLPLPAHVRIAAAASRPASSAG